MALERSTRRRFLASLAAAGGVLTGCSAPNSRNVGARTSPEAGDDNQLASVYRDVIDSVALVRTYSGVGGGQGSCFVFDDEHLVTNQHVVENADEIEVKFNREDWRSPTVAGTDAYSDLAVLSLDDRPDYATPLPITESAVFIGQEVLALGHPFGLASSVSSGIVSGVDRVLPAPNGFSIPDAVQTTAAVNPGNSGGPLVTMDGEVAGVISSGGGDNIGFAISAPLVSRVVPSLVTDGEYAHSYLGVRLLDVTPLVARPNDLAEASGVLVLAVQPDGPSDGVLRESDDRTTVRGQEVPVGGDVLVELDGREVPSLGVLSTFLALETSPGDEITATVLRDGRRRTVSLTIGTRPPPN